MWTPLVVTAESPDARYADFGASTPMERPGQPAGLASIYVQLADPAAGFSSGQVCGETGGNGVA